MLAEILAAVANPSPERLEREAAWQERHPLASAVLLAGLLTGLIPSLAAALLP